MPRAKELENTLGISESHPLFQRKLAQVDFLLWCSDEINKLPNLRLERRLQEQFKNVHIARLVSEIDLEEVIDGSLEHERVVDRNVPNVRDAIPTWLTTPRHRGIHHIVRDEKVRLEELDTPSKYRRFEKLVRGECTALQDLKSIDDRDTPVEFPMWSIVAQVLIKSMGNQTRSGGKPEKESKTHVFKPFGCIVWHSMRL